VKLAVALGCPFEGPVKPDHVVGIADRVVAWEPDELAFADTIGVGVPTQVSELVQRAKAFGLPLGCHFHNTRNTGYSNAVAAVQGMAGRAARARHAGTATKGRGLRACVSGSTLTHKLISPHLVRCDDELLVPRVDQVLIEDATGLMAALQFEPLGVSRCQVPLAVCYMDHNVLQIDEKNKQDHLYLQAFCRRYGVHYSKPGNGISHYVHLERFGRPGEVLIGADSHSSMAGAVGMLAIGVGGLKWRWRWPGATLS
jgi:Aconitase family (aconitate hydratase)/HMGL-like